MSTQNFINNYDKYQYDSFIFGNSYSVFYEIKEWTKYINSKKCYHFDALSESIYGVMKKIEYLNKKKVKIKNALIITDAGSLSVVSNDTRFLYKKHPALSDENYFSFHAEFLKAFLTPEFLRAYLSLLFFKSINPDMNKDQFLFDYRPWNYDSVSNELSLKIYETMIAKNKNDYYKTYINMFPRRDMTVQQESPGIIKKDQIKMLLFIKKVFDLNKTEYRIIISPEYCQIKFNTKDLQILYKIFSKKNVYDFSGINDFTNDIYNYYEPIHYRPVVSRQILAKVYAKDCNYSVEK